MSNTPETDAAVTASGGDWSPVLRAVAQRLERERDKHFADLNAANKSLQYCSRAMDQLESTSHSLSQALQTFVPLLDADITTMGRRELQRALKLLTPLEQQAIRIREHLANDCKK
jgi:hypothetical protein